MFILGGTFEYSEIKRLGDLQKGMVTQCVKSQTILKPNVFRELSCTLSCLHAPIANK